METTRTTATAEAQTSGGAAGARQVAGRVTCGPCNRLLRLEAGAPSRHVSCDECAGLLLALAS